LHKANYQHKPHNHRHFIRLTQVAMAILLFSLDHALHPMDHFLLFVVDSLPCPIFPHLHFQH